MNFLRAGPDETQAIRPSLIHNGSLALGCLVLGVALLTAEAAKLEGAMFMGIFLLLSAAVIMTPHLPGCTGIWFDDEGFLVRDLYTSERYRWSEVGPFTIRRRLLATGVEFPFTPPGETMPQSRSLPRGLGRSAWRLANLMNEKRQRAIGAED